MPARAHLALPVFDQPNLKARWSLTLDGPAKWQMVSNGAEIERQRRRGDRVTVRFAETEPLSTYLFSFVAGDFEVETAERNGRTFRMFHRETDAAKVARNREAIFDLHARALEFMERYTGIPYAFGKFDFVLIPGLPVRRHGACRQDSLQRVGAAARRVRDAEPVSRPRLDHRARNRAHVVRRSRDDALVQRCLDEGGLRQLHGGKDREPLVSRGESRAAVPALALSLPPTTSIARLGANAIRQPLANLNEAGSLYGAIIYQKAPIVMRHLEH